MDNTGITFIDDGEIKNKTVILRVDFNVSLSKDHLTIADDERIRQSLPTIQHLLQKEKQNSLIILSHLGRPDGKKDQKFSLKIIQERLQSYIKENAVELVENYFPQKELKTKPGHVYLFENVRFHPEEEENDAEFSKTLSSYADVFVNDAFGVSHRAHASVVGITQYLPSYGGLLLKKEIQMISKFMHDAEHPVVAIIGGAKIETKLSLLDNLLHIADYLIIGGGLANTFLYAQRIDVGKSYVQKDQSDAAQKLLFKAAQKETSVVLPEDCLVGNKDDDQTGAGVYKVEDVPKSGQILDIGPETKAKVGAVLSKARTIIWNGPVGYFENPQYQQGTDFIYYTIANNREAFSLVGGGDTLAAISKKEYLENITHISTGGGAMLEFIEKGSLPGIDALRKT